VHQVVFGANVVCGPCSRYAHLEGREQLAAIAADIFRCSVSAAYTDDRVWDRLPGDLREFLYNLLDPNPATRASMAEVVQRSPYYQRVVADVPQRRAKLYQLLPAERPALFEDQLDDGTPPAAAAGGSGVAAPGVQQEAAAVAVAVPDAPSPKRGPPLGFAVPPVALTVAPVEAVSAQPKQKAAADDDDAQGRELAKLRAEVRGWVAGWGVG